MAANDAQSALPSSLIRQFITACHILHHHGVLDAYGHLSVRHPADATLFLMSRNMAPGTVSSPDDVVVYRVADAAMPVDAAAARAGFAERYIHSEIYRRHAGVGAAVHSHSEAVVPFSVVTASGGGVPLRPVYHMAGFLEPRGVPVFEIDEYYDGRQGEVRDMLVKDARLGEGLARCFDGGRAVVLMRGHGFTAVGEGIEEVVLRAVYTQKNAAIQTAALTMGMAARLAAGGGRGGATAGQTDGGGVRYLSEEEAKGATQMTKNTVQRPWRLWVREVEASGLYVNSA